VPATASDIHPELDDVLYQSVVDEEFRAIVTANPEAFGLGESGVSLPAAVEAPAHELLDLAAGAQFSAQCQSTCSYGLFTVVCDGTTK
jgi:hypothetical protein